MSTGRILQVSGHPRASLNDQWLLYELQHHFQMPEDGHTAAYHNRFKAIPWSTEFRPPLKAAKPCTNGLQIGRVIEPARLDEHHRLQVELWPADADGHAGQGIWLPIIHSGSGQANLPKAGSDVHVSFLEGDPDRPVLCATDTYTCAGEETQSIILAANGNVLQDGDTVTLVKDLKIKGSSSVVKVGTKVKNIRLIEGDHDIDCKIEGFGPMQLKSEFIKKA